MHNGYNVFMFNAAFHLLKMRGRVFILTDIFFCIKIENDYQ